MESTRSAFDLFDLFSDPSRTIVSPDELLGRRVVLRTHLLAVPDEGFLSTERNHAGEGDLREMTTRFEIRKGRRPSVASINPFLNMPLDPGQGLGNLRSGRVIGDPRELGLCGELNVLRTLSLIHI